MVFGINDIGCVSIYCAQFNGNFLCFFKIFSDLGTPVDLDLAPAAGSLTFDPGESVRSLRLTVLPDDEPETDEIFTVQLTGASVVDGTAAVPPSVDSSHSQIQVLIRHNDAPVRFSQVNIRFHST